MFESESHEESVESKFFEKDESDHTSYPKIKRVFCDVDGVLIGRRDVPDIVHGNFVHVLRELNSFGIRFHLSTGRGQGSTNMLLKFLGLSLYEDVYHIIENGIGAWRNTNPPEFIYSQKIHPNKEALKFKTVVSQLRVLNELAVQEGWHRELEKSLSLSLNAENENELGNLSRKVFNTLDDAGINSVFRIFQSPTAVDVIPSGVGKSLMIDEILELLNKDRGDVDKITWSNLIVLGDSYADIRSLAVVNDHGGVSVCPANASKEVKKVAQIVTKKEVLAGTSDFFDFFLDERRKQVETHTSRQQELFDTYGSDKDPGDQ